MKKKKAKKIVSKPPKKKEEAVWFDRLLKEPLYRGTDAEGKGVGVAYLGEGFYVTWSKGIAAAFAQLAVEKSNKYPKKLVTYKLKPGLKILDNKSKIMFDIKRFMGVEPWDKISTPAFATYLTMEVKNAGYDGVIDDNPADGLVIFDKSFLTKINEETL